MSRLRRARTTAAPRRVDATYPGTDVERGGQVSVAWKLGHSTDPDLNLRWSVLSDVLLGNPAAPLVLIGEAPGPEDDRAAAAFAGPLGALLDRMFGSIGLDRTGVLLTTLVPWRPPGNRAPTEAEVQACLPFLLRRLQLTRPRRLVLLGGLAAKTLTGSAESARRLRGRWRSAIVPGLEAPVPALPMLPLDQVARSPALKQATWADLLTLRQALDTDQ